MQLVVEPGGAVRCIYTEAIDLHALGRPAIARGSRVEPDDSGHWHADLSPVAGPRLGPFNRVLQSLKPAAFQQCFSALLQSRLSAVFFRAARVVPVVAQPKESEQSKARPRVTVPNH